MTRAIVTVPENYFEMTANLVAPLVINLDAGLARQFVLTSMEYDTRHYLLPQEVREGKVSSE
jgi:flagellar assembly factor FliW